VYACVESSVLKETNLRVRGLGLGLGLGLLIKNQASVVSVRVTDQF